MPVHSLGVGDDQVNEKDRVLEDEDFFKPESLQPGTVPEQNPNTRLIAADDKNPEQSIVVDVSNDAPSVIENVTKAKELLEDIKERGTVDQVSMESATALLPQIGLLPARYFTHYPSRVHYDDTVARIERFISSHTEQ